jgi:hypothetical protein
VKYSHNTWTKKGSRPNKRKIIGLALLICCICTPSIIACPYCGFIISRNTFAASTFILGIVYIFCFYGLKILMSQSKLNISESREYSLGIAFICGICFYYWLKSYPIEVYMFERPIRSLLHFSPLRISYELIVIVGITLSALLFRVYRSKCRFEHFVFNVVGFALPIFWLFTLIRYTPRVTWDVRIMKIMWIMIAFSSISLRLFPIACCILGFSILVFFVLSGSFDTLSFSIISLTLAAILFVTGDLFRRKYKTIMTVNPS